MHTTEQTSNTQAFNSANAYFSGKQTVVSYCSLGYRSAKYAEALSKQLKKG